MVGEPDGAIENMLWDNIATREYLAEVAATAAQIPFHGDIEGKYSNQAGSMHNLPFGGLYRLGRICRG